MIVPFETSSFAKTPKSMLELIIKIDIRIAITCVALFLIIPHTPFNLSIRKAHRTYTENQSMPYGLININIKLKRRKKSLLALLCSALLCSALLCSALLKDFNLLLILLQPISSFSPFMLSILKVYRVNSVKWVVFSQFF